jgi:hypothetical protein
MTVLVGSTPRQMLQNNDFATEFFGPEGTLF